MNRKSLLYRHQNTIVMCILALIIVIMCTVLSDNFLSFSNAASTEGRVKCFTSYEVQPGDTLWSISLEHVSEEYSSTEAYLEEVIASNHLKGETIQAGHFLMIPYYRDAP